MRTCLRHYRGLRGESYEVWIRLLRHGKKKESEILALAGRAWDRGTTPSPELVGLFIWHIVAFGDATLNTEPR